MKVKLTIQERNNLKRLVEAPQVGRTSLGDVKMMLSLVDTLEYKGDKEDISILTEVTIDKKQFNKLYELAHNFNGWPVAQWVLDMKEKLDKYNESDG